MKTLVAVLALAAPLLCAGQITLQPANASQPAQTGEKARVDRQAIAKLEMALEDSFNALDQRDPVVLLGAASGIYLEGYGIVFTTPLDLMSTPRVTPFAQTISKAQADRVRQVKLAHIPILKEAMRNAVVVAARTLTSLPDASKIVVAARIFYLDWENRAGLPSQIVLTADRASALAGNIQTEEQ